MNPIRRSFLDSFGCRLSPERACSSLVSYFKVGLFFFEGPDGQNGLAPLTPGPIGYSFTRVPNPPFVHPGRCALLLWRTWDCGDWGFLPEYSGHFSLLNLHNPSLLSSWYSCSNKNNFIGMMIYSIQILCDYHIFLRGERFLFLRWCFIWDLPLDLVSLCIFLVLVFFFGADFFLLCRFSYRWAMELGLFFFGGGGILVLVFLYFYLVLEWFYGG